MAFLTCRMLGEPEVGWDYDFAVILDDLGGMHLSEDGQVEVDTGDFSVCFFLLVRDIRLDELAYYVKSYDMKPLWIREGVELPTLDAEQRESVQEREMELFFGDG